MVVDFLNIKLSLFNLIHKLFYDKYQISHNLKLI